MGYYLPVEDVWYLASALIIFLGKEAPVILRNAAIIWAFSGASLAVVAGGGYAQNEEEGLLSAIFEPKQEIDTGQERRVIGPDGTPLGWDYVPEPSPEASRDDDLLELEMLSRSSTGVGFNAAFYDAESDNPLIPVSVTLRALDKITAQYIDLEIPLGNNVRFGTLDILPRICDKRPPEEFPETSAFLEIFEGSDVAENHAEAIAHNNDLSVVDGEKNTQATVEDNTERTIEPARPGAESPATTQSSDALIPKEALVPEEVYVPTGDTIFKGWMFASSLGLNALEHSVYDVWVIDCNMVDPEQLVESL